MGVRWEPGGSKVGARCEPGGNKVCTVLTKMSKTVQFLYSLDIFLSKIVKKTFLDIFGRKRHLVAHVSI